ncbi:hypothetical protein [Thioclava indica]|uniref:hypothetical protein n=1 Tax=Thioclava indica TaxID=1353528 RepID=UPI0012DD72F1|nr:hypothetical protein [Thioclava indica]
MPIHRHDQKRAIGHYRVKRMAVGPRTRAQKRIIRRKGAQELLVGMLAGKGAQRRCGGLAIRNLKHIELIQRHPAPKQMQVTVAKPRQ